MTTIIIENADKKNVLLIGKLAKALGLSVTTKPAGNWKPTPGIITNPDLIKRIEKVEKKKAGRKVFTATELKDEMDKMGAVNA
ncbi:hypothetical protein BH10BAC3_BH10BAC3_42260 [soil metagenome]